MLSPSRLQQWQENGLQRQRKVRLTPQSNLVQYNNREITAFCSNDYLGLANHPEIIKALQKGAEQYGAGSGASQLISGYSQAFQMIEEAFAEFLQQERALFFANGYMANLGVLSALAQKQDIIYQDHSNHASLLDGGKLSSAQSKRFLHNNMHSLNTHLNKQSQGHAFIVSDAVFSMSGEIAPLPELCQIADRHQANLIIDEAHSMGVLGQQGAGITEHFSISPQELSIQICPLGKAFGCYGAIVAGSDALIEQVLQFSRSYIYTTAPPPALACAALKSLEIVKKEHWRREQLQHNIVFFKQLAQQKQLPIANSDTAIQTLCIQDPFLATKISEILFEKGLHIYACRYPTVKKNQSLLRITLNALHTEKQITCLLDQLEEAYDNAVF